MSVAQGILAGVQGAQASFRDQRDSNRQREALALSRESQDIATREDRKKTKQENGALNVGKLHLADGADARDYRTQNWEKVATSLDGNQAMAALGNQVEGWRKFTRDDGVNIQADLHRFDIEKDEATGETVYIPMMKRTDTGDIVPMTEGRNEAADSPVVKLSLKDLTDQLNGQYREAVANGGYENDASYAQISQAAVDQSSDAILRKQALEVMTKRIILEGADSSPELANSPAEHSKFASLINGIEDVDELRKIAAAQGIDVDAVQAQVDADVDAKIFEAAEDGSLPKVLFNKGITRKIWEESSPEKREIMLNDLNKSQDFQEAITAAPATIAAVLEDAITAPWDTLVGLGTAAAESTAGQFLGLSKITDDKTDTLKPYDSAQQELAEKRERTAGTRTVDEVDKIFDTPFELTSGNIQAAILEGTSEPTLDQQKSIASFLDSKGVKNRADLEQAIRNEEITANDAKRIAFVAAMTSDGDSSAKNKVAQEFINIIERGQTDVSKKDQATMDYNSAAAVTAQYSAETTRREHEFAMQKYDQEQVGDAVKDSDQLLQDVMFEVDMVDKDGNPTAKDFEADEDQARKIGRRLSRYVNKIKQARGPVSAEAYMNGMNASIGYYVQAMANADVNDFLSKENILDFFRPDARGNTSFDLAEVRVGERNRDGSPKSVVYVTASGVNSQALPLSEFQNELSWMGNLLSSTAELNSKTAK